MSEPRRKKRKPYCFLSKSGKWLRLQEKKCNTSIETAKASDDTDVIATPSDLAIAGPSTSKQADRLQSVDNNSTSSSVYEHECTPMPNQEAETSSDVEVFGEPITDNSTGNTDQESSSECSSKDEEGSCSVEPETASDVEELKSFLRQWAVQKNVPISTLSALCVGLKTIHSPCFNALPIDGRTILKTPVNLSIETVAPGQYIHIGLERQLNIIVSKLKSLLVPVTELKLLFNIDGLPLFSSSQGELYPILLSIPTIPKLRNEVYPIGLYYGMKKPEDLNCFFSKFLNELINLINNGIVVDGVAIDVEILGFCCDVPAKSYILGTTSHTGYRSCTRCKVHGITIDKRRVFLETDCPPRTHQEFVHRTDEIFQPRTTPLVTVPGLIFPSSFVLDYMHLICLGVMRSMLFIWCSGPLPLRLSARQRIRLSEYLLSARHDTPVEFVRKPREITILKSWKATEYRMFLLYFGPVILKELLDEAKYLNFLSLHVATNILLDWKKCADPDLLTYAENLLLRFVTEIQSLYGKKYITHNFHNLTHIVDDVRFFVSKIPQFDVHKVSAFQFENFLQTIKRKVRGRARPLQQIGRRLGEEFCTQSNHLPQNENQLQQCDEKPCLTSKHYDGPLPVFCGNPQYRKVMFNSFEVTLQHPNNCCLLKNGTVIVVDNLAYSTELKEQVFVGRKFVHVESLYDHPLCPSADIGIFKVSNLSGRKRWPLSVIKAKCLLINFGDKKVAFTLLHSTLP